MGSLKDNRYYLRLYCVCVFLSITCGGKEVAATTLEVDQSPPNLLDRKVIIVLGCLFNDIIEQSSGNTHERNY